MSEQSTEAQTELEKIPFLGQLAAIEKRLDEVQGPILEELRTLLEGQAGNEFGSHEANKIVARAIQRLMDRLGTRILCPETGKLCTIIGGTQAGSTKHGVFRLRFSKGGTAQGERYARARLPKITVVDDQKNIATSAKTKLAA